MDDNELIEEFWNPEEKESITGIVTEKKANVGPYDSMLYKIHSNNIIYCIWGKTRLDELMENVHMGDKVKLTYLGLVNIGDDYHRKEYGLEIIL